MSKCKYCSEDIVETRWFNLDEPEKLCDKCFDKKCTINFKEINK